MGPSLPTSNTERTKVVNLSTNKLEHRDFRVISEPTFRFLVERYELRGG